MEHDERDPDRVSLAGVDPVAALRALLAVDPDSPPVDTDAEPQSEKDAAPEK